MKKPPVARVRSFERAEEILALCEEHGVKAIVGVEPDQPEDISGVEKILAQGSAPPTASTGGTKVGRNAPCPCGSGKKYKKCCGSGRAGSGRAATPGPGPPPRQLDQAVIDDIERLDRWSNGVIDAIEAHRFEEAEDLCRNLLKHYPTMIDAPERLAALRVAQGRWPEAVEAYDRALAVIAKSPSDYDTGGVRDLEHKRDEASTKACAAKGDSLIR